LVSPIAAYAMLARRVRRRAVVGPFRWPKVRSIAARYMRRAFKARDSDLCSRRQKKKPIDPGIGNGSRRRMAVAAPS
jgi:hypothetical protein